MGVDGRDFENDKRFQDALLEMTVQIQDRSAQCHLSLHRALRIIPDMHETLYSGG